LKQHLKKRGIILGIVTALLVLIALLSLLGEGRVSFVQNGVAAITRPLETGIRSLVGTLEQMYDYMHNFDTLQAEHQALLAQVAEYQRAAREAAEVTERYARLRELLNFSQGIYDERIIDAHILSWDASNWTSAFTIDRGADYGLQVGDAVMTERRELIGVVREVGRSWATVHTIIDPAVRVGGQMGTGVSAIAGGNFALMQDGTLRLSHVPSGEVPLLNDTIVTSGLGGVIPQGLAIGRVERVGMEDTGISYYAVLEPAMEINRLVQVFIVQMLELPEE